jgi:hypothetical protein
MGYILSGGPMKNMKKFAYVALIVIMLLSMSSCGFFAWLFGVEPPEEISPYTAVNNPTQVLDPGTSTVNNANIGDWAAYAISSASNPRGVFRLELANSVGDASNLYAFGSSTTSYTPGNHFASTQSAEGATVELTVMNRGYNYVIAAAQGFSGAVPLQGNLGAVRYPDAKKMTSNSFVNGSIPGGYYAYYYVDVDSSYDTYDITVDGFVFMRVFNSNGTSVSGEDIEGFDPSGSYFLIEILGQTSSTYELTVRKL